MVSLVTQYEQQQKWRKFNAVHDLLGCVSGLKVMDVGCGVGVQLSEFQSRGCEVVGIDADKELAAHAREKLLPNGVVEVRDFDEADFWPSAPYDIIWSSFVIAYAKSPIETLRGWHRTLKVSGRLVLIEMNDLLHHLPMNAADQLAVEQFYDVAERDGQYDFRAGSKIRTWVEEAGYEVECELKLPDAELVFDGPASSEVMSSWRSRFQRMPHLISMAPDGFVDRFLQSLEKKTHVSMCSVNLIIANKVSD